MTPLGLTRPELAQALGRYRLRLHALIHELSLERPGYVHTATYSELETLSLALEVDLEVRQSEPGQERMTEVESDVLVPLLRQLHARLGTLLHTRPSKSWLAPLHAADELVAGVERSLAGHT